VPIDGDQKHHDPRMALDQAPGRLDSAHAWHPDVHDHQPGREVCRGLERRLAGAGLPDDGHPGSDVHEVTQNRPEPG
jgi:hypothetical protein